MMGDQEIRRAWEKLWKESNGGQIVAPLDLVLQTIDALILFDVKCKMKETGDSAVAPVRHGQWLPQIVLGEKAWDCSECKTLGSPHWKWCPMCGCRMDGEERPTCHDGVCDIPGISQGEIIGGAE